MVPTFFAEKILFHGRILEVGEVAGEANDGAHEATEGVDFHILGFVSHSYGFLKLFGRLVDFQNDELIHYSFEFNHKLSRFLDNQTFLIVSERSFEMICRFSKRSNLCVNIIDTFYNF